MVHGTQRAYLAKGTIHTGRRQHIHGRGMGSVLLNTGGAGAGSSYSSVDDYVATTHRNLFSGQGIGKNLASMNKKIEGLLVKKKEKISISIFNFFF